MDNLGVSIEQTGHPSLSVVTAAPESVPGSHGNTIGQLVTHVLYDPNNNGDAAAFPGLGDCDTEVPNMLDSLAAQGVIVVDVDPKGVEGWSHVTATHIVLAALTNAVHAAKIRGVTLHAFNSGVLEAKGSINAFTTAMAIRLAFDQSVIKVPRSTLQIPSSVTAEMLGIFDLISAGNTYKEMEKPLGGGYSVSTIKNRTKAVREALGAATNEPALFLLMLMGFKPVVKYVTLPKSESGDGNELMKSAGRTFK